VDGGQNLPQKYDNNESVFDSAKQLIMCNSLLQVFCAGISSLQLFVQSNWLGCHSQYFDSTVLIEPIEKELTLDGECLIPLTKNLPLLLIAKVILSDMRQKFQYFKVVFFFFLCYLYLECNFTLWFFSCQTGGSFGTFLCIKRY